VNSPVRANWACHRAMPRPACEACKAFRTAQKCGENDARRASSRPGQVTSRDSGVSESRGEINPDPRKILARTEIRLKKVSLRFLVAFKNNKRAIRFPGDELPIVILPYLSQNLLIGQEQD
jgi:hypothetical protein